MLNTIEGRGAARLTRPSDVVTATADASEVAQHTFIVQRLARRLGVSLEFAALVAELALVGQREASR